MLCNSRTLMSQSFRCPACDFETDVIGDLGDHMVESHAAKPVSPVRHPLSTPSPEWSAHDVNAYFDELVAAQQSAEQEVEDVEEVEQSLEGLMQRREVAEFLAVSVRTIQRIEARGDLPRVTVRGLRLAFYRRRDVEQLLGPQKPAKFKLLRRRKRGGWEEWG